MRVPIACSLDDSAARSQVGEWQTLIASAVGELERSSPTTVTMTLEADLVDLRALVLLAQREKACCPFFDFDLVIDADRVRLLVSVPEEAADVLDELCRLPSPDQTVPERTTGQERR